MSRLKSKPKKRILVDLDGITADFFGALFREHRRRTGERVVIDQILSWNMSSYVKNPKVLMDVFRAKGFFAKLKPLPGAVKALKRLARSYDVVIATYACTPHAAAEKILWCQKHLPFLNSNNIILGHRKYLIKADAIIDDGSHNLAAYSRAWPEALLIAIAYPYNAPGKVCDYYRVEGCNDTTKAWDEIVKLIEKTL